MAPANSDWSPCQTVAEAERTLRQLGVQVVEFHTDNLFLANTAALGIMEMQRAGLELIPRVRTDTAAIVSLGIDPNDTPAWFDHHTSTLFINPAANFWSGEASAAEIMANAFADRYYSSGDMLHLVRHEYGHFLHFTRNRPRYLQLIAAPVWSLADQSRRAAKVSRWAAIDPGEFVAEVFAGLKAGVLYDQEVMDLHRYFGGPLP